MRNVRSNASFSSLPSVSSSLKGPVATTDPEKRKKGMTTAFRRMFLTGYLVGKVMFAHKVLADALLVIHRQVFCTS